jgi:hypothetical protein
MNTFKFKNGKFVISEGYGSIKKTKKEEMDPVTGIDKEEELTNLPGMPPSASPQATAPTAAVTEPVTNPDAKADYKAKKGAERAAKTGGKEMAGIYQKTVSPEANKLSSLLVSKAGLNKNDATLLANNFFNYYTKERGQIGKKATTPVTTTAESKLREGAGNLELKNKLKPFIDYLTKNLPADKKAALTSPTVLQVLADAVATKVIYVPGLTAAKAGEQPKAAEKKPEEPKTGEEDAGESKPKADPNTIAGQLQLAGVEDVKSVIAKIDAWAKQNKIEIDPKALKTSEASVKKDDDEITNIEDYEEIKTSDIKPGEEKFAKPLAAESKYYNPRKPSSLVRHPALVPYRVR